MDSVRIVPAGPDRGAYLPLFDLADDSAQAVAGYHQTGDLYVLDDVGGQPLAIVLVVDGPDDGWVEVKSVAVAEASHGTGVGSRMLQQVIGRLRDSGVAGVVVGTANSSVRQLGFYQRLGFRIWWVEPDYFSEEKGYPAGLTENGIPVRDMVWMRQRL